MAVKVVAVVINLYDGNQTVPMLLSSTTLTSLVGSVPSQFEPRLLIPVTFGSALSAQQYGQAVREAPAGGGITFVIDEWVWPYVPLHWQGMSYSVYEGEDTTSLSGLTLLYTGRVADLSLDLVAQRAQVSTTDASLDLDKPLINDLYAGVPDVTADRDLTGFLNKTISGDTTLTGVESTSPGFYFTGALSATARITLAVGFVGKAQVVNATSGGHTLAVGFASGATVTAPVNDGVTIFSDGTTIVEFDNSEIQTTIASLANLPRPRLWGTAYSVAPVLEDLLEQIWRISSLPLDSVSEVRVGDVPWAKVTGVPGPGQWSVQLTAGTLTLGSVPLGSDVRCDAKAPGWETLTTSALMTQIAVEHGLGVNTVAMNQFAIDAPELIGYWVTTTPMNILDMFDHLAGNVGGWWGIGPDGLIRAGVIAAPAATPIITYTDLEIVSIGVANLLPPAWRIRVQFKPVWSPVSGGLPGVTEAERAVLGAQGLVAPSYENDPLRHTSEPRAVDVPLIQSFVLTEADALLIRNRLVTAWTVPRRLLNVAVRTEQVPDLYTTVAIDYQMISGNFRVHSVTRSIGGGPVTLQLWG